jgi:hypothetical protein
VASVLAFVLGSLVLLDAFLLLMGTSIVHGIEQSLDEASALPASWVVNGLLDLVVGAALITGGLLLGNRRPSGRATLAVANVIAVVLSIYWTSTSSGSALPLTVLHAALALVGLAMAFSTSASAWLRDNARPCRTG